MGAADIAALDESDARRAVADAETIVAAMRAHVRQRGLDPDSSPRGA